MIKVLFQEKSCKLILCKFVIERSSGKSIFSCCKFYVYEWMFLSNALTSISFLYFNEGHTCLWGMFTSSGPALERLNSLFAELKDLAYFSAQVLFPFFFLCLSTCLQIDMRYAQRMLRIIIVVLTYCSISWTHMCNVIRGRCSPALCRAVMIPTDKLVQQVFIGLVNTRDLWLHVWDSNSATCSQRAFLLHTHSLWKILNDQQKTSLLSVITDSN